MKSERDRPITIEDILRLKRAERPPAEFWTTFDRELRAKQLSALVGKRPWWQDFPKTFPRLFRYRIPLGASAVIALTLVSLHDRRAPSGQGSASVAPEPPAVVEIASVPVTMAVPAVQALPSPAEHLYVAATEPVIGPAVSPTAIPDSSGVRPSVALGGGLKLDHAVETPSPSATVIAANLSAIGAKEPAVSQTLMAQNSGFEVRHASVRAAVEPLQQMTPPGESRRLRYLTAMVATASSDSSYRTSERAASRIAEERLYDQIQRFGARGDRVQLKF